MAAPRLNPSGFFEVTTSSRMDGKLELFGYGQNDKAINPGDLVIITTDYLSEGFSKQRIEASLKLRGRDMHLFVAAAVQAMELYEANKEWLGAPISHPGQGVLDPRSPMVALTHWQKAAIRNI